MRLGGRLAGVGSLGGLLGLGGLVGAGGLGESVIGGPLGVRGGGGLGSVRRLGTRVGALALGSLPGVRGLLDLGLLHGQGARVAHALQEEARRLHGARHLGEGRDGLAQLGVVVRRPHEAQRLVEDLPLVHLHARGREALLVRALLLDRCVAPGVRGGFAHNRGGLSRLRLVLLHRSLLLAPWRLARPQYPGASTLVVTVRERAVGDLVREGGFALVIRRVDKPSGATNHFWVVWRLTRVSAGRCMCRSANSP